MSDELDARIRALEAERIRPARPRPDPPATPAEINMLSTACAHVDSQQNRRKPAGQRAKKAGRSSPSDPQEPAAKLEPDGPLPDATNDD